MSHVELMSVSELGAVTRAVLEIVADGSDERSLAERVCTACVAGLDIDGAGLSVLTGSPSRETSVGHRQHRRVVGGSAVHPQ